MKKFIIGFLSLMALYWCSWSSAADLVDVYCEAMKCDPTFNAAFADLLANRENIPINRALLLPRLDVHADAERQKVQLAGINFSNFQSTGVFIPRADDVVFYNNSVNYYLKLSQPVFYYAAWAKLQKAKASVKQAEATFCASVQDLMVRVVRAYFDVLIADANLFYTKEHRKAVAEQLRQTQEQFRVGVVAITNVYEAKANYDLVVAQEVGDRYLLSQKIEALRKITNNLYGNLKGLSNFLPLITPQPTNINDWVCAAEKQNYQLIAARNAALVARENVKVQEGDKLPVIKTFGEFIYSYDSNLQGSGVLNRNQILEGGVELDWAPLQGGGVIARTNQAIYQYQQACQEQERVRRDVIARARDSFLGIFSGIAQVRAQRASIYSSQLSLKATVESYKVGMRTILDVLDQEAQLYNAQKNYAKARYDYVYQTVLLKQAAGTLCVSDLQKINTWLYCGIDISLYDSILNGCLEPSTH